MPPLRSAVNSLTGIISSLPTPLAKDGKFDNAVLTPLIDHLIDAGVSGLVPVDETGEYAALSLDDRIAVVRATVDAAKGRVPVIAAVRARQYDEALAVGLAFKTAGADALLLIIPTLTTSASQSLRDYVADYARATGLPIVLNDDPVGDAAPLDVASLLALIEDGSIVAVKTYPADDVTFKSIIAAAAERINILTGSDARYSHHVALGADGGILASSVLLPHYWRHIADLAKLGDFGAAVAAERKLLPLLDLLKTPAAPGPLKTAMALIGRSIGNVAPNTPAPDQSAGGRLEHALRGLACFNVRDLKNVWGR